MAIDPVTGNVLVGGLAAEVNQALTGGTFEGVLARVLSSPLTVTMPVIGPQSLHAVYVAAPKGRAFRHPVALVTLINNDTDCFSPSDYQITIRWGDGTHSAGTFGETRTGAGGDREAPVRAQGVFPHDDRDQLGDHGRDARRRPRPHPRGGPSSAGHHRLIVFNG